MTRFFFLLAALPYFAGSAAAHPAILPDSSVVVRPDTAASDRTVYLRVDEPPRFQGGDVLAFRDWVLRHLRFGAEMFREGVDARLVVSFVVGRQGAVEEPEVVSSTDERCAAEVLRVLASAPLWTPGRLEKVAVRTKLVMPVNIRLEVPTAADSLAAGLSDGIPLEEDVAGEMERMPLFQGGDLQSFRKWVMENLKYPREALEDEVEDDIVVTFIVEKDGTLSDIVVGAGEESGPDPGSGAGAHPVAQLGTRTARERRTGAGEVYASVDFSAGQNPACRAAGASVRPGTGSPGRR